jgi:predicted nucleic acid-binding protein
VILVDTSVWVDHFRSADSVLSQLLEDGQVLAHPAIIGELALGQAKQENSIIRELSKLLPAEVTTHEEVLHFIRQNALGGSGIGYADAHLLASTRLTRQAGLWTRDRRLATAARRLGLDADVEPYTGLQEEERGWTGNEQGHHGPD